MALSDQLLDLSKRAKKVEDHAATMKTKAKSDIQQEIKEAREEVQSRADALRKSAEDSKGQISAWWDATQRSWNDHVTAVRKNVDDKRAAHDLKAAQRYAGQAEADAAFAIDYAYAALEEADYAVLDATLARMEVAELKR